MSEDRRNHLTTCPKCGCRDLFVRKDFPQKLGLAILILAGGSFLVLSAWRSMFFWGAMVLLGAVILDAVLYLVVPRVTVCYKCRGEFREVKVNPEHHGFELAIGEKYRQ